jgi:ribosomal subunit interface protein
VSKDNPALKDGAALPVQVKGHQIDVGQALRSHVQDNLSALVGKYFEKPLEATVVFSREAHLFRADIHVHAARGITLQSNASANDPYPAFDDAAGRMATQLSRHKKKLISLHHHQARPDKQGWPDGGDNEES